jgi:hypothetical protein
LGAGQPNSLKGLSADEMTGYLRETSSQGKWQDWQFRQLVDALQLLLGDLVLVAHAFSLARRANARPASPRNARRSSR